MPEGSEDATILIAISWQSLIRAKSGDEHAMICDCIVVVVFAGFFIEANLNHILEKMGKIEEMNRFLGNHYPGLQDKLAWFYNCYIAKSKSNNKKQLYQKLRRKFPGFNEIYQFRNNISHGIIDSSVANLKDAERLRIQAKTIVDELFKIANRAGYAIPRTTTYRDVITNDR